MKQKTIGRPFQLSGIGLHSGKEAKLFFSPAQPNSGIYFLKQGEKIPALADYVTKTKRGTCLGDIAVTEHILAAIYALGIDNLQIEIKGDEPPALDGSALPWAQAFLSAGLVEQDKEKNFFSLKQPIRLSEAEASLEAVPYHGFKIGFMVDFPVVGRQSLSFDVQKQGFIKEIAPARTFGYREEYEELKKQGLALGASFDNALVLGKSGYQNKPRFPDEIVRHKILDLIGDMALLGRPLLAQIKAVKSGHKLNIELVRRVLKNV